MTDVEIWKAVNEYEGYYEISNLGSVKSIFRAIIDRRGVLKKIKGRVMRLTPDKDGYLEVRLCMDNIVVHKKVHRLVAEHFVENPNNLFETNHKDLSKANNRWDNLEFSTRKANQQHALAAGLFHRATNPKRGRVFSAAVVAEIRQRLKNGEPMLKIARECAVNFSSVRRIKAAA